MWIDCVGTASIFNNWLLVLTARTRFSQHPLFFISNLWRFASMQIRLKMVPLLRTLFVIHVKYFFNLNQYFFWPENILCHISNRNRTRPNDHTYILLILGCFSQNFRQIFAKLRFKFCWLSVKYSRTEIRKDCFQVDGNWSVPIEWATQF